MNVTPKIGVVLLGGDSFCQKNVQKAPTKKFFFAFLKNENKTK